MPTARTDVGKRQTTDTLLSSGPRRRALETGAEKIKEERAWVYSAQTVRDGRRLLSLERERGVDFGRRHWSSRPIHMRLRLVGTNRLRAKLRLDNAYATNESSSAVACGYDAAMVELSSDNNGYWWWQRQSKGEFEDIAFHENSNRALSFLKTGDFFFQMHFVKNKCQRYSIDSLVQTRSGPRQDAMRHDRVELTEI